jgi:hypothetical protein
LYVQLATELKALQSSSARDTALMSASRELLAAYQTLQLRLNDDAAVPLRRETLSWLIAEARAAREILTGGTRLDRSSSVLASITKDVRDETAKQDDVMGPAGLEPRAKVTVTLKSAPGAAIRPLRVYYTLAGLMPDVSVAPDATRSFMAAGETVSELLPIKDYKIWAAPEGEPRRILTGVVDVRARARNDGDEVPVTLLLK